MTNEKHVTKLTKSLPVRWEQDSDSVKTKYATHFTIQHSENEFFLSFYEIRPPLLLGDQKQVNEQLEKLEHLNAECVSRIAISFKKIPSLVKAIEGSYQVFLNSRPEEDKEKSRGSE